MPKLYACEAVCAFRLGQPVLYEEYGFHTLEVGARLETADTRARTRRCPCALTTGRIVRCGGCIWELRLVFCEFLAPS